MSKGEKPKKILTKDIYVCYTLKQKKLRQKTITEEGFYTFMTLFDELYFEITLTGTKSELKKFVSFLRSGELDDFFEMSSEYINYDDGYQAADDDAESSIVFTNDDMGIEIDEIDTDEFLELFCRAGKNLDIDGRLYDCDDEEYSFVSALGDSYYLNSKNVTRFNDELDERAYEEESEEG